MRHAASSWFCGSWASAKAVVGARESRVKAAVGATKANITNSNLDLDSTQIAD